MNKDKLIAKLEELSQYAGIRVEGTNKLIDLRKEIAALKSNIKEPEGVTAEKSIADCLSEAGFSCKHLDLSEHPLLEKGIKLYADQFVQAYAAIKQPGLREELIKFFAWQNTLDINETKRVVDNYLKYRINEMDKT